MSHLRWAEEGEAELNRWVNALQCEGQGVLLKLGQEQLGLEALLSEEAGATYFGLAFRLDDAHGWRSVVAAVKKAVGGDDRLIGGIVEWSQFPPQQSMLFSMSVHAALLAVPCELMSKVWDAWSGDNSRQPRRENSVVSRAVFVFAMLEKEVQRLLTVSDHGLEGWTFYRIVQDLAHGNLLSYSTFSFYRRYGLLEDDNDSVDSDHTGLSPSTISTASYWTGGGEQRHARRRALRQRQDSISSVKAEPALEDE